MNLREKIDEFQMQTGFLADFCEFIKYQDGDALRGDSEYQAKLFHSALFVLSHYAKNVKKMSDELFAEKRMLEFYRSDEAEV